MPTAVHSLLKYPHVCYIARGTEVSRWAGELAGDRDNGIGEFPLLNVTGSTILCAVSVWNPMTGGRL